MTSEDNFPTQQVEGLKNQLEELQKKYDEVLKSGMDHCRRRMDLEIQVDKYKKSKERDLNQTEDLQNQVTERISEFMKRMKELMS